jgi:aspartate dehydrogenase
MTIALAGIGPDDTRVTLVADPAATVNRHETTARGAFGELAVRISSNPLPDNPRTSAMAALSLVRAIRNRTSALVI